MHRTTTLSGGHLFWALGLTIALGACSSSPDPVLYTIAPVAGAAKSGGPKIILLEQLHVASYLERSQIVKSSEDYRVDLKSNDWWGESLASMLRRTIQQELGQRLPASVVLNESGAVSASPDATIDIDIDRLDGDQHGNVVLQAQASVTFKGRRTPVVLNYRFTMPVAAVDVKGEVAAISAAVGQLADGLATALISNR